MKKIFAFGSYFNDFRSSLNEANDMNLIDISAELEREFGAYGSEERKKSLDQAWEEYNAQILQVARKSSILLSRSWQGGLGLPGVIFPELREA